MGRPGGVGETGIHDGRGTPSSSGHHPNPLSNVIKGSESLVGAWVALHYKDRDERHRESGGVEDKRGEDSLRKKRVRRRRVDR